MKLLNLWYLAHPVTSDEHFTIDQNMQHVLKVLRICHEAGLYAIAPWYAMVEAYKEYRGTPSYAAFRELGLNMDCETVRSFGGIILTGHMISEGMARERAALADIHSHVIDATGLSDTNLYGYLRARMSVMNVRIV